LLLKEKIPIVDIKSQEIIKNLINSKEKFLKKSLEQVKLLKEHRESLISAVVTGKIDVRKIENNDKRK
jgi:type I restriction enzyme S subunit